MLRRALSLLVLTGAAFAQSDGREPAPRFNAKSMSGETYNNASLKGKVVLLQFWTTWCQDCRGEQPLVDKLTQEFGSKGLVVLAVDVGESKKKVKQYLQTSPRACPIVLNEDTNLPANSVPGLCHYRPRREYGWHSAGGWRRAHVAAVAGARRDASAGRGGRIANSRCRYSRKRRHARNLPYVSYIPELPAKN